MPWAVDFFPPHIIEFTNLVTSVDPYTGSGATSRFAMCPFLGIILKILCAQSAFYCPSPGPKPRPGTMKLPCPTLSPFSWRKGGKLLLALGRRRAALGALGPIFRPALLAVGHAD